MHEPVSAHGAGRDEACALALAERIIKSLSARKETIAAAESCTGGLAADSIVRIPGASLVFWGSFVSYTEDAKMKMLGVPPITLEKYGPVSRETALAMAEGAIKKSGASWAFSITGFAGPGAGNAGNTADSVKAGTVWIAVAGADKDSADSSMTEAKMFLFGGSRNEVREKAVIAALEMVLKSILTLEII